MAYYRLLKDGGTQVGEHNLLVIVFGPELGEFLLVDSIGFVEMQVLDVLELGLGRPAMLRLEIVVGLYPEVT